MGIRDEGLHFFPIKSDDLSPENILAMIADELGFVVEHGFRKKQYIIKKPADSGYNSIKTLYCVAKTDNNKITLIGAMEHQKSVALVEPDCFDKLKEILSEDGFLLTSLKDFSTSICNNPRL